jgi:glycerol-3-phosphate dehydrogenase (NAD(P)+)
MTRVAVAGMGSWGTALALLLQAQGHEVQAWEFDAGVAAALSTGNRESPFLPGVCLPESVRVDARLDGLLDGADLLVLAVPSHTQRALLQRLRAAVRADLPLVNVAKGIEQRSLLRLSQVVAEALPDHDPAAYVCLSGPSHAEEVSRGVPTAVVAAGEDPALLERVQRLFSNPVFRVYRNTDLAGVELGGALKNVIALAAGMCDGLGFGDNTKAALMTRGMVEMARLGTALGGKPETFSGLAGIGDLIVTCASRHSRNRAVGEEIGRGRSLEQVLAGMSMVAEGVRTTEGAWELARLHAVPMPITEAVHAILFEGREPRAEVVRLMTRDLKQEGA